MGFVSSSAFSDYAGTADHRLSFYPALAPLKGPTGIQWTRRTDNGYSVGHVFITDKAKDPALAFRWFDGVFNDEVTRVIMNGVEGQAWAKPDAGALGINGKPALVKTVVQPAGVNFLDYAAVIFAGNVTADYRLGTQMDWSSPVAKYDGEVWLYNNTRDYYAPYGDDTKQIPLVVSFTEAENNELTQLKEQISTYVKEAMAAFFTGNKDIERDWESFKADLNRMNYTRYTQIYQTAYDRQYGKK
jgi:putative aldouronate transport system substrate-binding protein